MNEEFKNKYKERYTQAKNKGVKFWPDIIYKDLIVSFGIFILLVMLATFVGVTQEPKADPNDSAYIPRPEWYFLFLFEFLKFVPGAIEWVGTVVIPGLAVLALLLLPFIDRNPYRHWSKRKVGVSIMGVVVLGMVGLTVRSVITTPEHAEDTIAGSISEQIVAGEELYLLQCAECHGADGDVTVIEGVEGVEGTVTSPISSRDVMYTFTDETLFNITDLGQQDLGMPPFGLGYGGELQRGEIEMIVTFMRYTWDDRAEIPADAAAAGAIPELAEGEVPSYEVHVQPIAKRYCVSCHRPGKANNDYLMQTYEEILFTGENADRNVVAGDLESYLIQTVNHVAILDASGNKIIDVMPPTKQIDPKYIYILEQWVLNGMPETADQAAALTEADEPTQAAPAETEEAPNP